ncbi:MAG: imidazolonepropionase [Saprospiraceae bacterium]
MLLYNIKGLVAGTNNKKVLKGAEMSEINLIENAWLQISEGKIVGFGEMSTCPEQINNSYDATGRFVLPSWCDSHSHIVFAGSREMEFVDKIKGIPYEEIARRGGGILNSAEKLAHADESELYDNAYERIFEVIASGTGALEIKSGYGLSEAAELKMLRVIRKLKENLPIPIKATFLGAHTFPTAYKQDHESYLKLIIDKMLPSIAAEGLADYIDVFCEKVAFSAEETGRIIEAGAKYGLKAKIHTNQFNSIGGIETSIKHNAVSVDHLEVMSENEIEVLAKSTTIATLLPTAPFFINDPNFPPARKLITAVVPIALASDYNPGSSPGGNMNFVLSLACIKLRMTPEEAINAATLNGAAAMEISEKYGSIVPGKIANLMVTKKIPSLAYLPYKFSSNQIEKVMLSGIWY